MTLAQISAVTGAPVPPGAAEVLVSSVEFDSRKVRPGSLFVALPGEHVDGLDFANSAAEAGAVAVLAARESTSLPTLVAPGVREGQGADGIGRTPAGSSPDAAAPRSAAEADTEAVLTALSKLAHQVVTDLIRDGLTVIGVTGSAGKTSTKDLIAAVLARSGAVVAPPESFNNELGHPYTVLRADTATRFLVLEMSARGIGHIAALARTAPPRIGAVLNVGSAHLGEFGSQAAIARAKGELVESLPPAEKGGIAILNGDDPFVVAMADRTRAAVVTTGLGEGADIRAVDIALDESARAEFLLVTPEGTAPVHLAVVGEHQIPNALAAAAVARSVGMPVDEIAAGLSQAGPVSKWRMAVDRIDGAVGSVTLINDAYNANPESMRAALAALGRIKAADPDGTVAWTVLGEMAELGAGAPAAHAELGAAAAAAGCQVVAVGPGARGIADGASARGEGGVVTMSPTDRGAGRGPAPQWYPDIDTAVDALLPQIRAHDVVLVKASRAVGLERLADRLAAELPSFLVAAEPGGDGTDVDRARTDGGQDGGTE